MGDVADETLMAFADGELSPVERAHVEASLVGNPDLRARLHVFEATGRGIGPKVPGPLNEPVPQYLIDVVMSHSVTGSERRAPPASSRPLGLWNRIATALSLEAPAWSTALAYTAVLLAGVGAGTYLTRHGVLSGARPSSAIEFENGNLVARGRLAQLLEAKQSGIDLDLDDSGVARSATKARIRLTFKSDEGFCRLFEIAQQAGARSSAVACRRDDGQWRLRVHTAIAPVNSSGNVIRPAERTGERLLEETIGSMLVDEVFGADDETSAISRGWQR